MKQLITYCLCLVAIAAAVGCEKEIRIDLGDVDSKLAVDGSIEQGQPPIVILTRSVGYFEPTDINTLSNLFVHDADVSVSNGTDEVTLDEFCASDIPDSLLPLVSELTGLSEADLATINYCVYTTFNPIMFGEIGKTYDLSITAEDQTLSSSSTIQQPIPLDSLWFQVWADTDSLGFVWAKLSDPAGETNTYRWMARRINQYEDGTVKDATFFPPQNSVFDDQFFDGLSFEFAYDRGMDPNSNKPDDFGEEAALFKQNDTVVVKFSVIDFEVFEFLRQVETQQLTSGNPFAAPTSVPSNIEGGLGVWAAYGVALDTVVFVE